MTTTESDNTEDFLEAAFKGNMYSSFVREDCCDHTYQRHGQGPAGTQIAVELNSREVKEIVIHLPCEHHEIICRGSIRFVAKGRVKHTIADQPWSLVGDEPIRIANNARQVVMPSCVLNSQFSTCDITFAHSSSTLRAYMPLSRSNQNNQGVLAWTGFYIGRSSRRGCPHRSHTDCVDPSDYHGGDHIVQDNTGTVQLIETWYHPANEGPHMLAHQSFSERDTMQSFPPGCSLKMILTLRDWPQRVTLNREPQLLLDFTEFAVVYTTVSLHDPTIERPLTRFPLMDMHVATYPLEQGQTFAHVPITRSDGDLIPQFLMAFVAHTDAFEPYRMGQFAPDIVVRPFKTHACTFNGIMKPHFHTISVDGILRWENHDDLNSSRCAWLGRITRSILTGLDTQMSQGDVDLTVEETVRPKFIHNCILLVTDTNTQVNRETCAGVGGGRLHLDIEFYENAVGGLDKLYVVKIQKFDLCLNSPAHPQTANEISPANCMPSYAEVVTPM
uniref:LO7 n=1 Tax=Blueface angelfish adomavirus TaxID=2609871 RepID=A0A6F9F1V4_9VIRU|nr:TPA_asm: LO7 [Blueface angelfish adomavirus]